MMVATVTPLLLVLCAIANLSIGAYVLSTNPRAVTHRAFFLYAMPVAVWAFAVALTHGAATPALWHTRLGFAVGSVIPIAMLTFAEHTRMAPLAAGGLQRGVLFSTAVVISVADPGRA